MTLDKPRKHRKAGLKIDYPQDPFQCVNSEDASMLVPPLGSTSPVSRQAAVCVV